MRRPSVGSTVVLVPGAFGGLILFQRPAHGGPLRHLFTLVDPLELSSCVNELPAPRTVILCDARYRDAVAGAVLSAADLYIVPAAWLRGIEPWDTEQRAERAERAAALVTAHRQRPIEHLLGHRQFELLFPL
jgi:hypothetical protein